MGNLVQLRQFANPASVGIDYDELNAYNAAFHELGLRWHWDAVTYSELVMAEANAAARVRRYIGSHHPHLLRAYDAEFLVAAIESKKQRFEAAMAPSTNGRAYFDWAQSRAGELGT